MKKFLFFLFFLTITFFLSAESFQSGKGKITAATLNVRNIPSTGGRVIASLKRADIVDVINRSKQQSTVGEYTNYWYKVKYADNKTGWIFGEYLSFDVNLESGYKWQSISPLAGQRYSCIAIAKNGKAIAGAVEGNIFVSDNKYSIWRKIVPQALGVRIGSIRKITIKNNSIWIAASNGIWKSDNYGAAWAQYTKTQGLSSNDIRDIIITDKNEIYAATSNGINISTNNALRWSQYPKNKKLKNTTSVAVSKSGIVFAGTQNGLYAVLKNSSKWKQIGKKKPNMGKYIYSLGIGANDDLFIGTDLGLAKTNSNNLSIWTPIGGKTQVNRILSDTSGKIYIATKNGLNISLDNGLSWITYKKENGIASNEIFDIAIDERNGKIWVANMKSGISRTIN